MVVEQMRERERERERERGGGGGWKGDKRGIFKQAWTLFCFCRYARPPALPPHTRSHHTRTKRATTTSTSTTTVTLTSNRRPRRRHPPPSICWLLRVMIVVDGSIRTCIRFYSRPSFLTAVSIDNSSNNSSWREKAERRKKWGKVLLTKGLLTCRQKKQQHTK